LRRNRSLRGLCVTADEIVAWNRKRMPKRIPGAAGTKPRPRRLPLKCSNLVKGESTKDPVCIFECRRGFSLGRGRPAARAIPSHAIGRVWPADYAGTNTTLAEFSFREGVSCPRGWKF
jgi:hypothetical protein